MGKWNTPSFIDAFMNNKLGRKRVHGTYRVLEGDHCRLLVKAYTEYGRPAGSTIMAINLQPEELTAKPLCFWHWHNYNEFTYRMRRDFDIHQWQTLPQVMMSGTDSALLNSGIVEIGPEHLLVEIGDKPFLLHKMKNEEGDTLNRYNHIDPVSNRVATIAEAKVLTADPIGQKNICGEWWGMPQALDFMPPPIEPVVL
ncbi:MAG: hypothetical protein JRC86_06205 [Deltaproteobacteria bacterium]|nr:hypothetical protein [Deltaproteobacteria bacterium]